MPELEIIIVDLTREFVSTGLARRDSSTVRVLDDLPIPWRVVVTGRGETVGTWAGEESGSVLGEGETLDFADLHANLMRIEDEGLRELLVSAFWKSVCTSLEKRGLLDNQRPPVGYIVAKHTWPSSLLELFRRACASEGRIKLVGVLHETASLLIGVFQSKQFERALRGVRLPGHALLCVITAYDDASVDIVCFDYSTEATIKRRVFIRDYLHTTYKGLYDKLSMCDWLPSLSLLILLESAGLAPLLAGELGTILTDIAGDSGWKRYACNNVHELRMQGAGLIARSFAGVGTMECEYELVTAYNIGLRIDYGRFHPLVAQNDLGTSEEFPLTAIQAFSLRGTPGHEVRVTLYCGYSDVVEEATPLGYASISGAPLEELLRSHPSIIIAVLRLDSPGSGEFTIGLPPDGQVISTLPFTLPALVV